MMQSTSSGYGSRESLQLSHAELDAVLSTIDCTYRQLRAKRARAAQLRELLFTDGDTSGGDGDGETTNPGGSGDGTPSTPGSSTDAVTSNPGGPGGGPIAQTHTTDEEPLT
jgi:hypothetical protein